MKLRVKQGREYVLGGVVYKGGETVEVADKYARVLTMDKGPLERGDEKRTVDLPAYAPVDPNRATMDDTWAPVQDDISALRDEYKALLGRRPFHGWDADELRERMNTYQRRDMRAGE